MIKLYGNEIWNSNTPNQYKKVIIASESQFESITDALENAGLNYCGYMNNNKSYVAVGRATVSNLDKLNISYDSIVDSNNRKYVTNNIIGTAKYNDIGDKMYRKYNTDFAYKVAQRLTEQDIPFSGRIFGKNTTITVDNTYKDAINAIAHEIREQREFLYNDKAAEKNEPSATVQNSVTVSKEDNTENLFNALSVLHYKAPQLESLNSTVELLNNQPELIDLFSTMFENTSDFKPEQLNMLSMNFVKTYAGLSDSELILANVADFNEIKQSFINTNLADKLIENHGYSYAQSELIRDMVDMGIDYDTINLLDYTFSLTEMQTFIGAYSRSDYDSLINLVAKVKGVTRSEVEGMISDGTYTPALPDFNTLEKTLYFQESEVESITYMYYNPDAYSGGQFVITEVSYKQIAEAYKEYGDDYSHFFDFLDTTGEQRLIDVGSESFRTAVKKFYSGTEFAEGLNADIQHKLVELAVVPEIKLPEVRKIELIKVGDFYEVRGENAKTVADTLNLKVPDCELHIVDVEPTELQTELVEELSDRADKVNNGSVDPSQDNMLKITGDGRKLGLDPRLIDPSFDDDPGTKLNVCVNNVFDIYDKTSEKKLTQIIFCDLGVPGKNSSVDSKDDDIKSVAELDSLEESGKFCVYDDIRDKLIAKGVPADEIAYIHSAKTETQKSELFAKVRSGEVRILLGSTSKMGTGTNVQDKIIALHDLDVPWRPSDLEQRRGRMVRQGNINEKVHLYRYVTKGTFDAYSYQLLEKKQKFISQVMTSKAPGRKCADVDQAALTYSEIKALCTGDERIREKLTLENQVKELQALKSEYSSTKYELEDKVNAYPEARKKLLMDIGNVSKDLETVKSIPYNTKDGNYQVEITLGADTYSLRDEEARKAATKALTNAFAQVKGDANKNKRVNIGQLANFGIEVINDGYFFDKITATLRGNYAYSVELGVSNPVNLKKIENLLFKVENVLNDKKSELNKLDIDYKTAQNMLNKPFEFEDELNSSTKRLDELTTALNIEMSEQHKSADKPKKTHYFGKDFILGKKKSSKQIQNNEVMKSEPKRSEPEL